MTTAIERRTVTDGITLVRAGAAILVVYSVVGLWLQQEGLSPQPVAWIREWLNRPLRLGEDFGPVAVMLLLLSAGYTSAVAGRTGLWPRLRDGYLPVLVATLLAAGAILVGLEVWTVPAGAEVSVANLAGNLTFASHLLAGKTLVVPLAWVLGLQLVAILAGLDRRGWPVPVTLLAAIGVVLALAAAGAELEQLGRVLCFAPLVLIGHVTARVVEGVLPAWGGVVLGAVCFAAIAGADRTFDGLAQWWYPIAATYAVLVFLVAVLVPGRTAAKVAGQAGTRWLARYAEWLLVLSGVVGFALLGLVG